MADFYYQFQPSVWKPEHHRLMIFENQMLHSWHSNKNAIHNERLAETEKIPVGNFVFEENKWFFVNENEKAVKGLTQGIEVLINGKIEITNGKKILLSKEDGGRGALFTITNQKQ